MKKKLIKILERNLDYKPHVITGIEKCADEILKMAEFEVNSKLFDRLKVYAEKANAVK